MRKNVSTDRTYISALENEAGKQTPETILQAIELDSLLLDEGVSMNLLEAIKLSKGTKQELIEFGSVSRSEIRDVVNSFYQLQKYRIVLAGQIRAIDMGVTGQSIESNTAILKWLVGNVALLEKQLKAVLDIVTDKSEVGRWLKKIVGVGEVMAAAMLGYFDVEGREYATQFISYAGLNDNNRPWLGKVKAEALVKDVIGDDKKITNEHVYEIAARSKWSYDYLLKNCYNQDKEKWNGLTGKGGIIPAVAKVPYNRDLKMIMWRLGSSIQWKCNNPKSLYGRLYNERKVMETKNNLEGKYADQAAEALKKKNYKKDSESYKAYIQGKLPDAQITARSLRYMEKIFISHLFEEMYRVHYHKIPPRYYTLEKVPGHHKEIEPEVPFTEV